MERHNPVPVDCVPCTVGGKEYFLLWGPAARYHLQRWGFFGNAPVPTLAYGAAMLGTIEGGRWQSAGVLHPLDLAALVTRDEEDGLFQACQAAIKNTLPTPATAEPQPEEIKAA